MKSHIYVITFFIALHIHIHLSLHHSPFGPMVFVLLLWATLIPWKKRKKVYIYNIYSFKRLEHFWQVKLLLLVLIIMSTSHYVTLGVQIYSVKNKFQCNVLHHERVNYLEVIWRKIICHHYWTFVHRQNLLP